MADRHHPKNAENGESDDIDILQWKPSRHQMVIIITLSVMSLVIAFDATVIVTSLPVRPHHIDGTSTQAFWVGAAYLISSAVVMPFLAALSDVFGRRGIPTGSLVFFTVGTILCCAADSITLLLGGRVIQGIGAGGMYVLSLVVFTDIV
ncbi:MFS general substrate transporter, partial [Colletotrichum somersetense]